MNEADLAVRDAVYRMRVADHLPDFWDSLAGALDDIQDGKVTRSRRPAASAASTPGAVVPRRDRSAAIPTPAPTAAPRPVPADPRRVVVAADTAAVAAPPARPSVRSAPLRAVPSAEPSVAAVEAVAPKPYAPPVLAEVVEGRFGSDRRGARGGRPSHDRSPARRHSRVERDLAVVPEAMRQQRSNVLIAAVAVVALVMVAYAGNNLVRSRSGTGGTEDLAAENTSFNSEALLAAGDDPAARAVIAWVGQLGSGDADAAWAALGTASQEELGGREAFDDQFAALQAGYGAWATTSADVVLVTPVTASDEGTVSVVTLIGTIGDDPRADAFPVRITNGMARIEAFADAGAIGLETPDASQGAEVSVDDELAVLVPVDVSPVIRLDQGPALRCGEAPGTSLELTSGGNQQRCTYAPPAAMEEGGRVMTVAFTAPDGEGISARSVRFKAA